MPPYTFKLETVRRVRSSRRDELRGQLADAYQAADKLEAERRRLENEIAGLRDGMRAAAGRAEFDVNAMLDAQRHELILKNELQDLTAKAALIAQECEKRRRAVVDAERDVRVMDTLEQRGLERHRLEETRAENKQMDEIAGVLWSRRGGGGGD